MAGGGCKKRRPALGRGAAAPKYFKNDKFGASKDLGDGLVHKLAYKTARAIMWDTDRTATG